MNVRDESTLDSLFYSGQSRKRRNRRMGLWFSVAAVLLILLGCIIYVVFFRVSNVGKKTISVNGEEVEHMNGFVVHSKTWLERSQVETFLAHIHANGVNVPQTTKTYQGVSYVKADNLLRALRQFGDEAQLNGDVLQVTLKSNQSYSYQDKQDFVHQQEVWVNGKLIGRELAVDHAEATFVPTTDVAKLLTAVGLKSTANGKSLSLGLTETASPTPVSRPDQDGLIAFGTGQAIYAPDLQWSESTYLPINSVNVALKKLGWGASFSSSQWKLTTPAATGTKPGTAGAGKSKQPLSLAFVPFYVGSLTAFQDVLSHPDAYNALAADTWSINSSGQLVGGVPAGTATQATAVGDKVFAMVTNLDSSGFDPKLMTTVLSNQGLMRHLESEIVSGVAAEDYTGVVLDLEMIPASERAPYTQFVTDLAAGLHDEGKQLAVLIPADTGNGNEPWNNAYDVAKLGAAADEVIVMAYDYSYAGGPAGPVAPAPWVQQTLAYTISRVPADKVVLGVDTYGYDWSGTQAKAVSLGSVDSFLSAHHVKPNWDSKADAPWFQWTDTKGVQHTVYYENAKSTAAKLALAQTYGIAGIAVWRAGLEDSAVLQTLADFKKQTNLSTH